MAELLRLVLLGFLFPLFYDLCDASPRLRLSVPPTWGVTATPSNPTATVAVALPGSTAFPWSDQIPRSAVASLLPRADSSASDAPSPASPTPATTSDPSLAQLVVESTTLSSLLPGICGFAPVWNGSATTLRIIGCASSSPLGPISLGDTNSYLYDGQQICATTEGALYCTKSGCSTCTDPWLPTGCVDLFTSTSLSYDYSQYYWDTTYTYTSTYMYKYNYTSSTYMSTWTVNGSTSVRPETSIYTETATEELVSDMTSVTSCYVDGYYDITSYGFDPTGYRCQTFAMGKSVTGYQCRLAPTPTFSDTLLSAPTFTVLGLDELRAAFPSMTLSFRTSQSGSATYFWHETSYPTRTFPGLSTRPPTPSEYLGQIAPAPPACVNEQNVTCPSLSSSADTCWSQMFPPGPQGCYCSALEQTNCTSLCQATPNDRNNYFGWAMRLCNTRNITTGENNSTMTNFTTLWPEYANRSAGIYDDLLLWQWRLRLGNGTAGLSNATFNDTLASSNSTCALSAASKLSSFAIVNGITVIFTPLARRGWINRLTGARFGVPGSRTWQFTALLAVGLNLIATAINSVTVLRAPGYGHRENALAPSIGTLFFFWTARPRTWWVVTLLVGRKRHEMRHLAVGASAMLAEVLQQMISTATFFITVILAAKRGYYNIHALKYAPSGSKALTMYIAALFSLAGFLLLLAFHWGILSAQRRRVPPQNDGNGDQSNVNSVVSNQPQINGIVGQDAQPDGYDPFVPPINNFQATVEKHSLMSFEEAVYRMGLSMQNVSDIEVFYIWMVIPFLAQWAFWVGWVLLAGDSYCPPKLASITASWTMFELLGGLLGAL